MIIVAWSARTTSVTTAQLRLRSEAAYNSATDLVKGSRSSIAVLVQPKASKTIAFSLENLTIRPASALAKELPRTIRPAALVTIDAPPAEEYSNDANVEACRLEKFTLRPWRVLTFPWRSR